MEALIPCCSICLGSLGAFDEPTRLRGCGHVYHKECVRSWLQKTPLCPDCRKPASEVDFLKDFVLVGIIEQLKTMNVSFIEPSANPPVPVPASRGIEESNNNNNSNNNTNMYNNNQNNNQNNSNNQNNTNNLNGNTTNVYNNNSNNTKRCPAYHAHPLTVVSNPKTIYPPHGQWFCDICGGPSTLSSQMHHCMECGSFDMCGSCLIRGTTTPVFQSTKHHHPLTQCDPNVIYAQFRGKWHCNVCRRNNQTDMYHCFPCKDYDMCATCVHR